MAHCDESDIEIIIELIPYIYLALWERGEGSQIRWTLTNVQGAELTTWYVILFHCKNSLILECHIIDEKTEP